MNIRKWFEEFAAGTGEQITQIVFSDHSDWPGLVPNVLLDMGDVADTVLDHEFDNGYGTPEAPPFFAWSQSYVVWVDTYDGAERLTYVPRSPLAQWVS
jgi:hypothetical protein